MAEEKLTETKGEKIGIEISKEIENYFDEPEDSNAMEDEDYDVGEEDPDLCDYVMELCSHIKKAGNDDKAIKNNLIKCINDVSEKVKTHDFPKKLAKIFQKTLDKYYPEPLEFSPDFNMKLKI